MVKHIVLLQLKDYPIKTQKLENALQLKKALEHMKVFIDEIKYIEVGLNFSENPSETCGVRRRCPPGAAI